MHAPPPCSAWLGTPSSLAHTPGPTFPPLQGDLLPAIEHYHRALALRPDDAFAMEMLTAALKDEAVHGIYTMNVV